MVSSCDPREFRKLPSDTTDGQIKRALPFYFPISKEAEATIWAKQKSRTLDPPEIPEDERVEDAGLSEDITVEAPKRKVHHPMVARA